MSRTPKESHAGAQLKTLSWQSLNGGVVFRELVRCSTGDTWWGTCFGKLMRGTRCLGCDHNIKQAVHSPGHRERSVWKLGACKLTERVSQGCLTSVTRAHPLCYHAWRCSRQWIPGPRHNKAKSPPMRTALPGWNVRRLDKSIPHITLPQAGRRSFHTGGHPIKAELLSAADDRQRPEVSCSDDRACLLHTFCYSSVTSKYYLYLQLYCFTFLLFM